MMKFDEACEIVYQLALANALDPDDIDKSDAAQVEQCCKQHEALDQFHDWVVNEGPDR